jgi:hypothetical protein
MRLPKWSYESQIFGWQAGITVCPGLWAIGLYWEDDPIGVYLTVPLVMLSIERNEEYKGNGWECDCMPHTELRMR